MNAKAASYAAAMVGTLFLAQPVIAQTPSSLGTGIPAIARSPTGAALTWSASQASPKELASLMGSRAQQALDSLKPDRIGTRGPRDAQLFKRRAPSVVIVVTDGGLGSGSIIGPEGQILTNWHVVADAEWVGVIFKPAVEGATPARADLRSAKVIRVDQVADLALLTALDPPVGRTPIPLGIASTLSIGDDVDAIGHPTGEAWSYTKGIVSQIRQDYQWTTESGVDHRADVIQTQTPINPGNSGGPLFNEQGLLVGVNSFIAEGQGLNFAVSVTDVRRLLSAKTDRLAQRHPGSGPRLAKAECEVRVLGERRLEDEPANATIADTNCDGDPDTLYVIPDNPDEPIQLRLDSNGDGKIDIVVMDFDRDGRWDESFADTNGDGSPDMRGIHSDGSGRPTRVEPYKSNKQ